MTRPLSPYATQWRQFSAETTEHRLTVLHDDGLYRHLRMAKPGTGMWSWEIITWPWSLVIRGDIGSPGIFTREEDMLSFFRPRRHDAPYGDGAPLINPYYWSEKLAGGRRSVESYSPDRFLALVKLAAIERDLRPTQMEELYESAEYASEYEHDAREWLQEHAAVVGRDTYWDADLSGWDHHFILACYAIVTTVKAWDAR